MTSHISVERLSAYLDAELPKREVAAVERHLEECLDCRRDLAGLQRVVTGLRGLERAGPPSILGQEVARRVALERPPEGLVERLEAHLSKRPRLEPSLPVGFALVFALAAILYLFADALERREQQSVPIVVPGATRIETLPSRQVGERSFVLDGEVWIELDAPSLPIRVVSADSEEGSALLESLPGLEELLEEGRSVRLELDGETLEIRAGPPPGAPAGASLEG